MTATYISLFLLLSLLSFISIASAQFRRPPLWAEGVESSSELGLKGPVRKIETRSSDPNSKEAEVYIFNRAGQVLEKISGPPSVSVASRTVYRYDEAGRLVGYEGYVDGKLASSVSIKLGGTGLPGELKRTDHRPKTDTPQNWSLIYRYKFDSAGRVSERITTLNNPIGFTGGFIISFGIPAGLYRETFRYDNSGNETEYALYLPKPAGDEPFLRTLTGYDTKRRKVEETVPGDEEGRLGRTKTESYRYNDMDDVIETRNLEPITKATRREVGDRFKIIDSSGTVQNGTLISDRPNTILWDLTECSYRYDQFTNWTTKSCKNTTVFGTTPTASLRRTIEYYSK